MNYGYDRKLERAAVLVRVVDEVASPNRRSLGTLVGEAGHRFGFLVQETDLDAPPPADSYVIRHLIYRASSGFRSPVVMRVAETARRWRASASIAFEYANTAAMSSAEPHIDRFKVMLGDLINFLRPDEFSAAGALVSDQKLSDNAVCDTVRVKYHPRCLDDRPIWPSLTREERAFFAGCAEIYARHQLYLRSTSDGYFAYRRGNCFVITATKTRKDRFQQDRLAVVEDYNECDGRLTYRGAFLPSSDAVEAAVLLVRRPDVRALLHTHASRLFTRNPAFAGRIAVPPMPYGEPALGHALTRVLDHQADGLLIMREHGEVFCALNRTPEEFLNDVERLCKEATSSLTAGEISAERVQERME